MPGGLEDAAKDVANGSAAAVAEVQGAGRVCADELDLHTLPMALGGAAECRAAREDVGQGQQPALASDREVDEARPGDLGLFDEVAGVGEGREGRQAEFPRWHLRGAPGAGRKLHSSPLGAP